MNKIGTTIKMLKKVEQLKVAGYTEADLKKQLVEEVLHQQYAKLMRGDKGAGKEASDICKELISVIERVYHSEEIA